MAKRGTPDHPKTIALGQCLKIQPWAALGLLEALWHWTAKYAPTGDITDHLKGLAGGIRYKGDNIALIAALTGGRLIDQVDGRVYIHDWDEHAENSVRKFLARNRQNGRQPQTFADYYRMPSRQVPDLSGHLTDYGGTEVGQNTDLSVSHAGGKGKGKGSSEGGGAGGGVERALADYPGEVKPDWDTQQFLSFVDDEPLFFNNLALWKASRKWRDGFIPTLENYLRKGQWKTEPPPEPKFKTEQEKREWALKNLA